MLLLCVKLAECTRIVDPPIHLFLAVKMDAAICKFYGSSLLSQILAMNFCSLTTRGHSPITLTFTPHSQLQITQGLHFPSSTAPTQLFALITHTPENNLTSPWLHHWSHHHTLYSLGLPLALCRVLFSGYHSPRDSYLTEPTYLS